MSRITKLFITTVVLILLAIVLGVCIPNIIEFCAYLLLAALVTDIIGIVYSLKEKGWKRDCKSL